MDDHQNPLFTRDEAKHAKLERIEAPVVLVRPKRTTKRDIRDQRRMDTAAGAVDGLTQDLEIFGFTKGQFSLLDLYVACLAITGPAKLTVSTWTASPRDVAELSRVQQAGGIISTRFLLDYTMSSRKPEASFAIRKTFGAEAIRIGRNHAKFAIFENDAWKLVLCTSMNLNMNPRFENFTVSHDPELATFLGNILDEVWAKQPTSLSDERATTIERYFADQM